MSTVQEPFIHWFHPVGFRPAVVKQRKDFAGDIGTHTYVFVASDAHLAYEGKYSKPFEWTEPEPLFLGLLPEPKPEPVTVPVKEYIERTVFVPEYYSCCSHNHEPPPPPPPIPLPASFVMLTSALVLFRMLKH